MSRPVEFGFDGAPTDVSFVVIAFNEAPTIAACVRAILAQDAAAVREVIVVDDASADGTGDIVRDLAMADPRVRLHRLAINGGRGNARSVGVGCAGGSLVAMVDGDVVLPAHWLSSCLARLGELDAVGGTAVPDGDVAYLYNRFGLTARARASTMTITGNNGLYRRSVFERVAFDPTLTEGEDIALNHAMHAAGLQARLVPDLTVEHRESKSFGASIRWLYASGKGAARQFEVYHEVRLPDLAFAGQVLTLLVAIPLFRRRPASALLPAAGWLSAVAVAHMRACFRADRTALGAYVAATGVDALFVAAYDVGRIVGHVRRRRLASLLRPVGA